MVTMSASGWAVPHDSPSTSSGGTVAMANTTQRAMSSTAAGAAAAVKGEMCLQGGWENSGTHLQMLLLLLWEQSPGTPEERLHPHPAAQGRIVPSERASGGTGTSDGLSPYKNCQMSLKGGREAGHAYHSQSASEQQNKTKCSTDCRGSSAWGREDSAGSGPTLNWEHSIPPGHKQGERRPLTSPAYFMACKFFHDKLSSSRKPWCRYIVICYLLYVYILYVQF